jgi:hypothetical protein
MTKRFTLFAGMAICVMLSFCLTALFADADSPSKWASLEKAYAQANLELAQARLAQAKRENEIVKGSVSDGTLDELAAGVQLTKARLRHLQGDATGGAYAGQIAAAEDCLRGLEDNYAASLKANSIQAGSVTEAELRREQAEIAVSKARLASLRVLAEQPADVRVEWEISQLRDQVRALWARPLIED